MPRSVAGHVLHTRRRGMVGWVIGVGALAGVNVGFYPAVPDAAELEQLMEGVPEAMLALFGVAGVEELFTPAGYLDSQLFALMSPLVLLIFVVGAMASTLAGEERDGTLELLLANPLSRRRVLTEKGLAVLALASMLVATHLLLVAGVGYAVGLDLAAVDLVAAHVSLLLLIAAFGALALALAGGTGNRAVTVGLTAAVAVASYLVESLAPLVEVLERVRPASLFYLYRGNDPLDNGLDPLHAGTLAALTAALVTLGAVLFDRRDIGT